ncbi:glycerophosphodiester phosphodiesterase [Desulfobacula toluolica]|uniref:GlpQ: glycerophosphoryl diester phosphodiesterase n=1 Tax=Desulfobacula toluolica (strain DSM 7467 / Tol2) TaxID=651182 RepID=K0NCQ5_DESTT|nr:glycerophosphodiester phosphodiesterase family protein [Desulfobacula toluolica]CCK78465.1 GlpQ: glycerophosphoryl diester phosphodiesterase [Desulfobacula toluolica Tol2]
MICFAHRGASGHAPENTLLSVRTALEMGAPWIEIDVFCVQGQLVVIHDSRLERTTNGRGNLMQHSIANLRSLDAGKGEKIPFLHEVLELVQGRCSINIELKGPGTAAPVADLLKACIRDGNYMKEQLLASSFDYPQLMELKQLVPKLYIGANIYGVPLDGAGFADAMGVYSIHAHCDFISQMFVDDAHRRGIKVFVFTVNHAEELHRMAALGVDGVFTNYPELLCST